MSKNKISTHLQNLENIEYQANKTLFALRDNLVEAKEVYESVFYISGRQDIMSWTINQIELCESLISQINEKNYLTPKQIELAQSLINKAKEKTRF